MQADLFSVNISVGWWVGAFAGVLWGEADESPVTWKSSIRQRADIAVCDAESIEQGVRQRSLHYKRSMQCMAAVVLSK